MLTTRMKKTVIAFVAIMGILTPLGILSSLNHVDASSKTDFQLCRIDIDWVKISDKLVNQTYDFAISIQYKQIFRISGIAFQTVVENFEGWQPKGTLVSDSKWTSATEYIPDIELSGLEVHLCAKLISNNPNRVEDTDFLSIGSMHAFNECYTTTFEFPHFGGDIEIQWMLVPVDSPSV